MVKIIIDRKLCKECGICIELCPRKLITLDSLGKAIDVTEKCKKCRICEYHCPDFAITIA